jgi:membrane dipeptidase
MLGAEGLHQTGGSIPAIRQFFSLGVRYITLTHNCNNVFATCHTHVANGGVDGGLTDFGKEAALEMNRLGMMLDLSHVSVKTMEDSLAITRSPVMFSHSCARGISDHTRNVPDHVLRMIPQNGGIVMVTFVPRFLNKDNPENVGIDTVVDHIYHIVKLAGWDHVGIGGDFDGTAELPTGLKDVSCYPKLIEAVLERGATDEQVRKLIGENILRVWKGNEDTSLRLNMLGEKPREGSWEGREWTKWDFSLPLMFTSSPVKRISNGAVGFN